MVAFIYAEVVTTDRKMVDSRRIVVAVAAAIEPRWVAAIKAVDDRLDVRYEPQLLPAAGFPRPGSGIGGPHQTLEHEFRWKKTLAEAEVVLGWPQNTPEGLADLVRNNTGLRWVQATVGDAAGRVGAAGLSAKERDRLQITGFESILSGQRAAFAMFALLAFTQGLPPLGYPSLGHSAQPEMAELAGQSLLVVGLGPTGAEVARLGKAFGMHVLAVTRTGNGQAPNVDQLRPARFLGDLLPVSHALVLASPLTEKTRGMIGAGAMSRMRADSVLVNIGHGAVIDEHALVKGLELGQPAAAVLDASAANTLSSGSALRSLSNVFIGPPAAAFSRYGNERLIAVFTKNRRKYLAGDELVDLLETPLNY